MTIRAFLLILFTWWPASLSAAQPDREPGVPVRQAQPDTQHQSLLTPPEGENQRLYEPRETALIAPEAAQKVTTRFREAFAQGAPLRVVIYVNRALVEGDAGLKLTGRTERFNETTTTKDGEAGTTTAETSGENTYAASEAAAPSLADRQTVRDIERLFGRVFRHAGATLADQKAAAALMGNDKPGTRLVGAGAAKEREALKQIADIAVEVLVSSRPLVVRSVAGDTTLDVPDLQVTAIRLSDSAILGQAAASDVLGSGVAAGQIARRFGVNDITEATAFALLEDMLTGRETAP